MNLVPLFEEALEFQNYNGTVLSNGKAAVYYIGRTRLADIYNDVAAEYPAENPRILDNLGMGPVYVNPAFDYELVVFDAYDNELFSVKKYIHSKGEHSTANVVVTPSESIAVSAWTVGDVQVYMPYLTGQLGKVYTGIDPIVVNNTEDKISANHVPLGVQDPLYFVQDDEEGCIIGFSGQTIPEGVMSESYLGFENNKITGYNGSALSAGNEYEAGSYVDITDNTISVTGLQPEGDYAYNSALSSKLDVTATGQFLTGLPDDLVYTGDMTAYQPAGDYQTAGDYLSASDSGKFYPMEGNPSGFLTEHQSLAGYATEQWVEDKGYLTGVDIPESANWNEATTVVNNNSAIWNNTTNIVSSKSAQWGAANPQIPVTGINGIKISESGDKVVFEVSGDYATNAQLADKLDTTALNSNVDSITISYSAKPTDNPIYASGNDLKNVNSIQGRSDLAIVPNGVLQVPNVITAVPGFLQVPNSITATNGKLTVQNAISAVPNNTLNVPGVIASNQGGITANGLSADANYGLTANGLTADAHNGFSAIGISAGKQGPFIIQGSHESISSNNRAGFIFSSDDINFNSATLTTAGINNTVGMPAPKFEARNISGAGFSIEASGAKGYDESGNVVWDTQNPQVKNIISYGDTKTAAGGLNGNIILTPMPSTNASNLTSAPYVVMDASQASYFAAYGPSAQTPTVKITPGTITLDYAAGNTKTTVGYNDVKQELGGSSWTLTGSIQKRELEYDTNTSAITAIAGSAIGGGGTGGGDVPEGVMAESGLEYNAVNEISGYNGSAIAQYGAEKQWLVHDDTLVHAANSAQYALGVNLSAVAQLLGVDETVLWENTTSAYTKDITWPQTLSENITGFTKVKFLYAGDEYYKPKYSEFDATEGEYELTDFLQHLNYSGYMFIRFGRFRLSGTNFTNTNNMTINCVNDQNWQGLSNIGWNKVYKVIGIGRKA